MHVTVHRAGPPAALRLLASAPRAHAAFLGFNGRIAFDSERDGGDFDVWTLNPDGSDPVNLTPSFTMRADGSHQTLLTDITPEWQPLPHRH